MGVVKDDPALDDEDPALDDDDDDDDGSPCERAILDLLRSGAPRVSALRRSMFMFPACLVSRLDDVDMNRS